MNNPIGIPELSWKDAEQYLNERRLAILEEIGEDQTSWERVLALRGELNLVKTMLAMPADRAMAQGKIGSAQY